MGHKRRASILVAFAHPDDEIFHGGILAHLAVRASRWSARRMAKPGEPHPSVGPVDDLGALRVKELRRSCAQLGIDEPVLLRFHDSARKERQRHHDPHALANVDMLDVEAAVRGDGGVLCQRRPRCRCTRAPVLYRNAARGVLKFAEASRGRGFLDGLDPDVFSTLPEMVAITFDATPYLERKLSALMAHRSAFGVTPETLKNPPPPEAQMLRAFQRAAIADPTSLM